MSFAKLLSQTTILVALAAAIYIISNIGLNYKAKSGVELELIWKNDIATLKSSNKLPAYWTEIRTVEKINGPDDSIAAKWVKSVSSPIEINPNGQYKLEILFISDKENGIHRAVIRHHMIHIPSGNSVWELNRTYVLD